MKYAGACHCGWIKFEVDADINHVRRCNCSICVKRGALNFRVASTQLKLLVPLKQLSLYQWGTKTAEDYFCPKCGILTFRKPSALTKQEIKLGMKPFNGWVINVRCLSDVDLELLPIIEINGAVL